MRTLFLVLLAMSLSTSAFAYGSITGSTTFGDGSLSFNVSNSVQIQVASEDVGYTAEALHLKGSRVFVTNQLSSKLYWKDVSIVSADGVVSAGFSGVTAPAASDEAGTPDPVADGWNAL